MFFKIKTVDRKNVMITLDDFSYLIEDVLVDNEARKPNRIVILGLKSGQSFRFFRDDFIEAAIQNNSNEEWKEWFSLFLDYK